MDRLRDAVLKEAVVQLEALLTLDATNSKMPLKQALATTYFAHLHSVQQRYARADPLMNLGIDLCISIVNVMQSQIAEESPVAHMLYLIDKFLYCTIDLLGPAIAATDDLHAAFEELRQMEERKRRATEVVPEASEVPLMGFSRFKLLDIVTKDLRLARATASAMLNAQRDFSLAEKDLLHNTLMHALVVLKDCHVPTEMSAPDDPNALSVPTVSIAETSRGEEAVMNIIRRQQNIAIAAILKLSNDTVTRESLRASNGSLRWDKHALLEECALVLNVCSLYLVLLTKQVCAVGTVSVDQCLVEDRNAERALREERIPPTPVAPGWSGVETVRHCNHAEMLYINGVALTEDGGVANMASGLREHARSFVRANPADAMGPAFLEFTDTLATMTRARPSGSAAGNDHEETVQMARMTGVACALPYVLNCSNVARNEGTFERALADGTVAFISGMTIGEGFRGGGSIHATLLCFACLRESLKLAA